MQAEIRDDASSTVNATVRDDASSIVKRFARVERLRRERKLSISALCLAAKYTPDNYRKVKRGAYEPKEDTLDRLEKAVEGMPSPAPSVAALAALHRCVFVILARETATDPQTALAQTFEKQRPENPDWLAASRLRRLAMYLVTVELNVDNAALARAIGCERQNVHQARRQIEDMREDDFATDQLLDRVAAMMVGAA